MPFKSPWQVDVPDCSIATYLFKDANAELSKEPLFVDAARPDDHYLTLETYRLWVQKLACGLRKAGLQDGDRVLVFATNSIYYPVCNVGSITAGGIFTGSNVGYTARELAHALHDSDPKFIFAYPDGLKKVKEAAKQAKVDESRIYVFDGQPRPSNKGQVDGFKHWSTLLASDAEAKGFHWDPCLSREKSTKTVALNYSSGTTGLPKGVEISHRNYISNLIQFKHNKDMWVDKQTADSRHLCFLPLNHAMAQMMLGMGTPAWGGRMYIMESFNFMEVMKAIPRWKIDNLMLVPPIIIAMTKNADLKAGKIDLSSVKTVHTGAAPIGGDVLTAFRSLWPKNSLLKIRNGYGMSEATCGVTGGPLSGDDDQIDSVGALLANMEAKVVNDEGKEVGRNERGELWVKGPNTTKGYWRNEEATKNTITEDGWLQTGDICIINDEDLVYIVDRKKELIKVKGNQVAPAELEALLLEHPAVNDAAVIGVPYEGDEAPRAYVILDSGKKASEEDIAKFVAERVNKNKRLLGGVRIGPEGSIPKNPSGKILRKELRERAAKEQKSQSKL